MAPLELRRVVLGPLENNVYVLVCPATKESVIIDATSPIEPILEAAAGTKVKQILLTHGHADHTNGLAALKQATGVPVSVHSADAAMLPIAADYLLNEGERIRFGEQELAVFHTPGHTPGGVCFSAGSTLISGDTLFPGGPGNTKTSLGNFPQIIESVRRLFNLPGETVVYPGHGRETTIESEKPHLEEWIARGW